MTITRAGLYLSAALWLAACASTSVVNVWQNPQYAGPPIKKLLVVAALKDAGVRRSAEDEFVSQLAAKGVSAVASYSLLPMTEKPDKAQIRKAVETAGADGILVVRPVRVTKETAYTPGAYYPGPYGYRGFYGYYAGGWAYAPPSAYQYEVITVETNLWRTAPEEMVWSATTETVQPSNLNEEIKRFAGLIIDKLASTKLI
jgi:hypothetical protein